MKKMNFFKSVVAKAITVIAYMLVIISIAAIESESVIPMAIASGSIMWIAIYCGANGQFSGKDE
jgi:hypothetical protein